MNRRAFAGLTLAAVGGIFVPQFGAWYRRGSGLLVRPDPTFLLTDAGNVRDAYLTTNDLSGYTAASITLTFLQQPGDDTSAPIYGGKPMLLLKRTVRSDGLLECSYWASCENARI
jgi:hypothetical protein